MKISSRDIEDVLVVSMEGKLDTSTSGQARDEMTAIATSGFNYLLKIVDNKNAAIEEFRS